MKILIVTLTLISIQNLFSYEIIRDQIFETLTKELLFELTNDKRIKFQLVNDLNENAFVIDNDNIFLTKGIFKNIEDENALISIILHEYSHIKKNHIFQKKIKVNELKKYNKYANLFSLFAGLSLKNTEIMFGSSISINEVLIQQFLKNSREFENEADNMMIHYINKNNLDKSSTINFLKYLEGKIFNDQYRQTHPSIKERILKINNDGFKNNKKINNKKFTFLKAKYFQNSTNNIYNNFFTKIKKGEYSIINNDDMSIAADYELFKIGMNTNDPIKIYEENIQYYNNSYVKLEYLNYLIENDKEKIILDRINLYKIDEKVKKEFYFLYIMGKTYDYLNRINDSNFYFCNFYKKVSNRELSKYFCRKYDENHIKSIDLVNEINVNFN